MQIDRVWAMPTKNTFDCKPIGEFVWRYLKNAKVSIDPFAGNKKWATYTNDLNPDSPSEYHLEAEDFLRLMQKNGVKPDLVLLDPPYSPRQIQELYKNIGKETYLEMAHKTAGWKTEKDIIDEIITEQGLVLCFNWNSMGMGKGRGYEMLEILLVCHGASHNDTICVAEKRLPRLF